MFDLMLDGSEWIKPSAGLPIVQWSLLLALAAAAGHLLQRYWNLPKVLGYTAVGALAGFSGYTAAAWPLSGIAQFLIELGVSIMLFEAGGRLTLRWFRHNPMLLVQSVAEALVTYLAALWLLKSFAVDAALQAPLALLLTVASPCVLMRVVSDLRASGPVTERGITLAALNAFYVLILGGVMARVLGSTEAKVGVGAMLASAALLLFSSALIGGLLALALRRALDWMSPSSENTAVMQLGLIAAGAALASHFGGSAPLAALLAGVLLKALYPRPWTWPRQFGTASAILTILMFVLVAMAAAQAPWHWTQWSTWALIAAAIIVRPLARLAALALARFGSGASTRQTLWVTLTLTPMSAIALLLLSQFAEFAPALGAQLAAVALPLILLLEVLGALAAAYALRRADEVGPAHASPNRQEPDTTPKEEHDGA